MTTKMIDQTSMRFAIFIVLSAFLTSQLMVSVSARYLPTRSQDDRLEKLRELLKDLLESDYDKRVPMIDYGDSLLAAGRPAIYKRSASFPDRIVGLPAPGYKVMERFTPNGIPSSLMSDNQQLQKSMK